MKKRVVSSWLTLIILIVFMSAFFVINMRYPAFIGLIGLLLVVLAVIVMNRIAAKSVIVSTSYLGVNENGHHKISVNIMNRSIFLISGARVKVELENVLTGEKSYDEIVCMVPSRRMSDIKLVLKLAHCGITNIRINELKVYDMLFLSSAKRKLFVSEKIFTQANEYELPDANKLTKSVLGSGMLMKTNDIEADYYEFREYADGDSANSISYKMSARYGDYYVKEHKKARNMIMRVAIRLGDNRTSYAICTAIKIAFSACREALKTGECIIDLGNNNVRMIKNSEELEAVKTVLLSKPFSGDNQYELSGEEYMTVLITDSVDFAAETVNTISDCISYVIMNFERAKAKRGYFELISERRIIPIDEISEDELREVKVAYYE